MEARSNENLRISSCVHRVFYLYSTDRRHTRLLAFAVNARPQFSKSILLVPLVFQVWRTVRHYWFRRRKAVHVIH